MNFLGSKFFTSWTNSKQRFCHSWQCHKSWLHLMFALMYVCTKLYHLDEASKFDSSKTCSSSLDVSQNLRIQAKTVCSVYSKITDETSVRTPNSLLKRRTASARPRCTSAVTRTRVVDLPSLWTARASCRSRAPLERGAVAGIDNWSLSCNKY